MPWFVLALAERKNEPQKEEVPLRKLTLGPTHMRCYFMLILIYLITFKLIHTKCELFLAL